MKAIIPLITIAFIFGIFFLFGAVQARKCRGLWFWQELYLRKKGRKAVGVILDKASSPSWWTIGREPQRNYKVVIEVESSGMETYRVLFKYMGDLLLDPLTTGLKVPVLIDPSDEQRVVVDFTEMDRLRKEGRSIESKKAEKRLGDLLRK
jgi:hypothetical protein